MEGAYSYRSLKMMHHSSSTTNRSPRQQTSTGVECRRQSNHGNSNGNANSSSNCSSFSISSSFTNSLDQMPAMRYNNASNGTAVFGSSYSDHRRTTLVTSNTKYGNLKRTQTLNHTVTASSASISISQHQSSHQQYQQHQQQQQHWTTSDRAERVDRDPKLQRLVGTRSKVTWADKIEKRGVFTAAGHKAVHQQFLYGEAVERELKRVNERISTRQQRQQQQHQQPPLSKSRSRQHICRSLAAALSRSSGQVSSGSSSSSAALTSRRTSCNTITTNDYDTISSNNITRLKRSVVRVLTPEEREELLREIQDRSNQDQMSGGRKTLLMKSGLASIDRSHNRNDARMDDSTRSMNLRDVFDGTEGSHLVKLPSLYPPGVTTQRSSKSKKKSHHRASHAHAVVPTARPSTIRPIKINTLPTKTAEEESSNKRPTCTMNLLKMNDLRVQFDDEVSVDDECGWLPWDAGKDLLEPFRHHQHQSHATCEESDEDTFLPWKKDDDCERVVVRHPGDNLFQQPVKYQGCEGESEDDSCTQWPEVLKNHRARAA